MGTLSRMKSTVGGAQPGVSLASATALYIPDHRNHFIITGTTTITTIVGAVHIRDRHITLRGGSGCVVTLTSNNSPTANQMNLRGTDRTIFEDTMVALWLRGDGTWTLESIQ